MESDRWLGVELRHLAALQAVAEEGSFGRAAARLGYTQSAVSQQIATLERLVGERLVDRPGGPRPVTITQAGTVLLRHADGIIARLRAAQADLAALRDGSAGPLHVGTYQSVGARVLPEVMRRFSAAHSWSWTSTVTPSIAASSRCTSIRSSRCLTSARLPSWRRSRAGSSVVTTVLWNGCFCPCAAARCLGSLAPAKARHATVRPKVA